MSETLKLPTCGKCGAALSGCAPDGLCAACLLDSAFEERDVQFGDPAKPAPLFAFKDYELLEEIARGGMGVVYRARQISLNRLVAIKMILGGHLANAAEMHRFRVEAETAAQLQHPNIVAIHEVGEHAGQPFFSMDFVAGRSLAQCVHDGPLPARKAATYLKTIAEAVQYAHSCSVLHRDLKPSNILIDDADQPRVTDFGLAKRLTSTQDSGLQTQDLTQTGQVLGSPSFIPPEQAAGQRDKIGASSDVYSLGAMLYHCLTARPPFMAETLTQTLRMVAENDAVSPRLLNPSVPRDLETICLKCLEKDPQRRYATAQELADELGRHLRNEPIHARPIGSTARLGRWCRRKPTSAAAIALLLVVAIGSPIAALRINRERLRAEDMRKHAEAKEEKAQTEAIKSRQVAQFLKDMLTGVGPSVALGRDKTLLQEILDKTAERVGQDLTDQPEVEAQLRNTLGQVYRDLGQYEKMEEMHRKAVVICRKVPGGGHAELADSLDHLATALFFQGELVEAEATELEALAIYRRLRGDQHADVANSLDVLAAILWSGGQVVEAVTIEREVLDTYKKLVGNEDLLVARSLDNLAAMISSVGNLVEAETLARDGLEMRRRLLGNSCPEVATSLNLLAGIFTEEGKLGEAEKTYREALEMRRKLLSNDHPLVVSSLGNLVHLLERRGKFMEAETFARECLTICEKICPDDWATFSSLSLLGSSLLMQEKYLEAEPLLISGYEGLKKRESRIPHDRKPRLRATIQRLVQLYEATSQSAKADEWKKKLAQFDKAEAENKVTAP